MGEVASRLKTRWLDLIVGKKKAAPVQSVERQRWPAGRGGLASCISVAHDQKAINNRAATSKAAAAIDATPYDWRSIAPYWRK